MTRSSGAGALFVEFVLEQLTSFPDIASRRLFGCVGVSSAHVQFAIIADGALFFCVDDATRPEYERMGSGCFSYVTKQRRVNMKKYYEVPVACLEDDDRFIALARDAIRAAHAAAPGKRPARLRR